MKKICTVDTGDRKIFYNHMGENLVSPEEIFPDYAKRKKQGVKGMDLRLMCDGDYGKTIEWLTEQDFEHQKAMFPNYTREIYDRNRR